MVFETAKFERPLGKAVILFKASNLMELTPEKIDKITEAIRKEDKRRKKGGKIETIEGIDIGDQVRCFTFYGNENLNGKNAHYLEGIVRVKEVDVYWIDIEKEIINGKEDYGRKGDRVPVDASPAIIKKI
ncbi:MAG: hypothetical protein A3G49_00630 [Candidatus Sungbacteria bacterium RIFCSPLOWO2_12_FULL_41_11]|uniref:Uncharacterized protein n=1 Tax=Candidatus Sungbacteria bacterium RIFCSPLOWO2_12_FULL_41_11 TaxID=1802286 RepID=A0A1G2LN02_9BACT|nr:MAG: hypothetical protein UV01_C0009G0004 [Parcubacteria group bacterium GW2011_GWA2_42_14]OGZ98272.1 MAG: hypothetical protein A3D41_03635 [Candidatus Sungbacteria bacterium RIFCSPHIGHO2_02_FULL_41_12b]OHA12986.1 MAG: hypothetical protein A3G49_00630 [Candidatus Sungbacteria bacterium RIFCSPLOWO2_12_FULL_41_11]